MHQDQTKNVKVPDDLLPGVALSHNEQLEKTVNANLRLLCDCENILRSNGGPAAGYHLVSQQILRLYRTATCQKASISLETGETCSAEIIF